MLYIVDWRKNRYTKAANWDGVVEPSMSRCVLVELDWASTCLAFEEALIEFMDNAEPWMASDGGYAKRRKAELIELRSGFLAQDRIATEKGSSE